MTQQAALADLKRAYYTEGHPLAFSGIDQIYRYYNPTLSRPTIEDFLAKQNVYTTHKHSKSIKHFNPIYIYSKRAHVEIDLGTFQDVAGFVLLMVDGFTKMAFTVWVKNKNARTVLDAFKTLYHDQVHHIDRLVCDLGKEFWNKSFLQFCQDKKIKLISPRTRGHAVFAERTWGSLKTLLGKWRYVHDTKDFRPVLAALTQTYNNRFHRGIQTSPAQADQSPEQQMRIRHLNEVRWQNIPRHTPKYQVGQIVRIRRDAGNFERAHHAKFTEEMFIITDIHPHMRLPLYTLTDITGEETIRGQFSGQELAKVILTQDVHIDQILAREEDRVLVTFQGVPPAVQAWIHVNQIQ